MFRIVPQLKTTFEAPAMSKPTLAVVLAVVLGPEGRDFSVDCGFQIHRCATDLAVLEKAK
jgi:hypothetical protein